ncbi:hypothetical protein RclHR1_10820005 [Rhizophagus clarus]|uniref:Uncharacterized protein n=1 Tax=Rhizophagus clarus TaxID=94130 RepID=A0A2Z6QEQ7_9GLOM|nr:hypothetical protein RclHR1_10820005 [Rhizophagus clarus]GET04449.1 hypothetical protein GLOIN_2v1820860 [Rhizophagus clarus]
MDFESAFLGNEENFKEAFANNANISNFISKIKNFIYYSDVEMAMKLRNKNLAGVLWLSHLLERRDMNAKAIYLDIGLITSTKQTSVSPTTVTLITITDDSQSTDYAPESTKNIALIGNMIADHSVPRGKGKETNLQIHNDVNKATPPKPLEDNVTSIQPTPDTAESKRKLQSGKQKKMNKRTSLTVLTTAVHGDEDEAKGQLQSQPPQQLAQEFNKLTPMKGIINIPANDAPKQPHLHGTHINPYIQDLKSLSEDTFMTNSSTNGTHDQIADPPDKEATDDHPITVSAALDNLMIISDETSLSHPKNDKTSDTLFTLNHSFLPNCQKVHEEIQDNQYDTTILPNGNWHTIKKIKNPKAVFDALKSSITQSSNNISMHANTKEDAPITYDAYVKLSDIEEYFAVENKVAYIEILTRDFKGFMGIEINKKDNEIIVKNFSYKGMLHMRHYRTIYHEIIRLASFLYKEIRFEPSKNNPNTITVFITVKDLNKCKQLKDIWSIEIDRILYRFVPAHAKDHDIISRKKYSREFVGFDNQTTPAAVQEAYTVQNP